MRSRLTYAPPVLATHPGYICLYRRRVRTHGSPLSALFEKHLKMGRCNNGLYAASKFSSQAIGTAAYQGDVKFSSAIGFISWLKKVSVDSEKQPPKHLYKYYETINMTSLWTIYHNSLSTVRVISQFWKFVHTSDDASDTDRVLF